jgi:hypothetical protein
MSIQRRHQFIDQIMLGYRNNGAGRTTRREPVCLGCKCTYANSYCRRAITPPVALRAPGVDDQNTLEASRMTMNQGGQQLPTMRTIGEHEHDTPVILQRHVSTI